VYCSYVLKFEPKPVTIVRNTFFSYIYCMIKWFRIISSVVLVLALSKLYAQSIPVFNFQEFESLLHKDNDTTYVVNFWASWCIPCVEELPSFEKINKKYSADKFKMILVSLDFKSDINSQLLPFIKSKKIQAEVVVLSDPHSNVWINKVDSFWTGAIPATVVYKGSQRFFHEGGMSYQSLDKRVSTYINE